jgi:hypothetical protein
LSSPRTGWLGGGAAALLTIGVLAGHPASAVAQTPNLQDELDLQGRASLAIGSGARAHGMGGAFLARADDATAASWNPAGLSYLRTPEVCLVGARNDLHARQFDLAGTLTTADESQGTPPDFLSLAIPFRAGSVAGAVQGSFQRAFSFDGRRTIRRVITQVERPVLFDIEGVGGLDLIALGTGVRVTRSLRLGFTLNGWFNQDWLNGYRLRRVRAGFNPSNQRVRFGLSGWNANLGAIWTPVGNVNLGVVAKTPFTGNVSLARERRDSIPDQGEFENSFESDDVRLHLPGAYGFGSSWRPRSPLTISADYTRTLWSNARIFDYFTLPVTGEPGPPGSAFPDLSYPSLTPDRQQDTEQIRLGAEYVLIGARAKYPVRVGLFSDRQYFRAGDGSIPRFTGLTLGAGIIVGPVMIDGAFVRETDDYGDGDGGRTEVDQRRLFFSLIYRPQPRP